MPDNVILSLEEIAKYNEEIESKTTYLYDLNKDTYTKEEIIGFINNYPMPDYPIYDGDELITTEEKNSILSNCNIETIKDFVTVQKALIVKRTNLRAFPTDISFYKEKNATNFDNNQETENSVNTPVLILHNSKDNKYVLGITKTYAGWINVEDLVLVNDEDYDYFTNTPNFVIVTDAFIELENTILDMGVKLPFNKEVEDGYEVILPTKDNSNHLVKQNLILKKDIIHLGYLPYTKQNIYLEAFKYEGTPYSWGGKDFGIDCSGYVSNVYKTFGFIFPRNTSSQNTSVGKIISLNDKTNTEKLNILKGHEINLLYEEGHVLIYLGMKNNKHYVINASGNKSILKVIEEELDTSYHLDRINKLVLVNKNF